MLSLFKIGKYIKEVMMEKEGLSGLTNGQFEIIIASDVDRDALIAELYHEEEQCAEIIVKDDYSHPVIRLFPSRKRDFFIFDLNAFLAILLEAKKRLEV
jgi:hypothetical protein